MDKRPDDYASDTVSISLRSRLQHLRFEKNITQAQLSDAIGISRMSVSNYESGDRIPDAIVVAKLANFFEVTTDYILGVSEFKNMQEAIELSDSSKFDDVSHYQSYWALDLYRKAVPIFKLIDDVYTPHKFGDRDDKHLSYVLYQQLLSTLNSYDEATNAISSTNINNFSDVISNLLLQLQSGRDDSKTISELAWIYLDIHGDSAKV